jgi:ParB-like chromosome segregation protein Spo0J
MDTQKKERTYVRNHNEPFPFNPMDPSVAGGFGPIKSVKISDLRKSQFCQDIYDLQVPLELEESIHEHGVLVPIMKTEDGKIIDGHRRVGACEKLGLTQIPAQVVPNQDFLSIEFNRQRIKTLSEKIKEGEAIKTLLTEKAKQRQLTGKKADNLGLNLDQGRTLELVAPIMGMSRSNAAKVFELSEKRPDLIKDIDKGRKSIHSAHKDMKRDANADRHRAEQIAVTQKSGIIPTLRHGDFNILGRDIAPNSVDLILTDLPYLGDDLHLWEEVSELGDLVLKPGGKLVSYCGHYHLPQCMNGLAKHLDYYWLMALKHSGQCAPVFQRNLIADFKPILVYAKPPLGRNSNMIHDLIVDQGKDKMFHEWGQGVSAFEQLIEDFCPLDGNILEPCAGGGSVIQAALNKKRQITAFELNDEAYKILEQRFPNHCK